MQFATTALEHQYFKAFHAKLLRDGVPTSCPRRIAKRPRSPLRGVQTFINGPRAKSKIPSLKKTKVTFLALQKEECAPVAPKAPKTVAFEATGRSRTLVDWERAKTKLRAELRKSLLSFVFALL